MFKSCNDIDAFMQQLCKIKVKIEIMKTLYILAAALVVFTSCKNTEKQGELVDEVKLATIDSMNLVAEKQRIIDSMQLVHESTKLTVVNQHTTTTTQTAPARKKWSGAAKGAVIGAGVGAVTGALVDEKSGRGAIIGGLAGAGVGAGTGAIIDDSKK